MSNPATNREPVEPTEGQEGSATPRALASSEGGRLTTLARGLNILEFVAKSKHFVRLRDVAEQFNIDRSGALRFLRTLELEGYLVRHEAMKVYSVGPKLLSFPRLPAGVEKIIEHARPILTDLARTTRQISHLAVLSGSQAVLVEVVPSGAPVSVKQAVGDLEPLNSSAVGKALYAFLPEAERKRLGRQIPFVPHTANTITGMADLELEGESVRQSGVAFDRQEGDELICCLGCPVLDSRGHPVASIGLSYVQAYLTRPIDEYSEHIGLAKEAARAIQQKLLLAVD